MLDAIHIVGPRGEASKALRLAFAAQAPAGCEVAIVETRDRLLDQLRGTSPCRLVVVEETFSDRATDDVALVRELRDGNPNLPIVLAAHNGDVDLAARAVAAGATDFLVCGARLDERIATLLGKLRTLFDALTKNRDLDAQVASLREAIHSRLKIIGESPQIQRVIDRASRVALVPRPVLIVGERGTGKELVARAIHSAVQPALGPIVTVNCAVFSDGLLESELFGHERGAFTGAEAMRRGKFELADGGTLFLDEIGHMSLAFQQKILRVVEYGTYTRVGGSQELQARVRVIAATNADLKEKIRQGEFLSDLYDRLAFEVIEVPPLRERDGDVEVLAHHFLEQFAREIPAFQGKSLSDSAVRRLKSYRFPGNVRELKNIIERAAYRDVGGDITPEDLGLLDEDDAARAGGKFKEQVDEFSRRLLIEALEQAEQNQAEAARALGLSYHQFRYLYRKYVG